MSEFLPLYCATDHEIYATLMSSPQHFSLRVLGDMARRRGILYSSFDTREELIDRISTQNFSAKQLREIQAHFDYRGRGEKRKVLRLDQEFTVEEIRKATDVLSESLKPGEKVFSVAGGLKTIDVNVQYTDVDFSLVRLRQRQRKEANINFEVLAGKTIISLPSGQRASAFFDSLRNNLAKDRPAPPKLEEITLAGLSTALKRTRFFIELISFLPSFTLSGVVKIAVERAHKDDRTLTTPSGGTEEDDAQEETDMLGVVQNVALRGEDLLQSRVYQDLRKRHYYIRSVRWKARRETTPYPTVEFECGFDDEELGGGFRFSVLGQFVQTRVGSYQKTISPVNESEKKSLFKILDEKSIDLYRAIGAGSETPEPDPIPGAEVSAAVPVPVEANS